ncbi:hypothetical protein Dimus_037406 [Dionaea muscipula]
MEYVNISRKCGKNPEYTKPLEITGRFANDDTDHEGRKSEVGRDETFSKGSGDNRRRDEEVEAQEEDTEKRKKKEIRMTLVGRAVIDEATIEGNRARMIDFMMLEWR